MVCDKEGDMVVVTTYKGMSLCGKVGHMVVTSCKGMSLCGKEGDGRGHMQRDVTLW